MRNWTVVTALAVGATLCGTPASADEAKTMIQPSLLIDLTAPRAEERAVAYDESLRRPGPAPKSTSGDLLEDGTVRYGNVTVTVRNPCPPGTAHYEPPPLPGRRARN